MLRGFISPEQNDWASIFKGIIIDIGSRKESLFSGVSKLDYSICKLLLLPE